MNYFTSSDPRHDMLGGGCQVRVASSSRSEAVWGWIQDSTEKVVCETGRFEAGKDHSNLEKPHGLSDWALQSAVKAIKAGSFTQGKNHFSGSEKLFFPKVWALDMLYSHPQAQKKTTFRAPKSCFFQKRFWAPEMLYPSHMPARLGQKSWYIPFLRQKGSPTGSKKNNFSEPEKLFFPKVVLSARHVLF